MARNFLKFPIQFLLANGPTPCPLLLPHKPSSVKLGGFELFALPRRIKIGAFTDYSPHMGQLALSELTQVESSNGASNQWNIIVNRDIHR